MLTEVTIVITVARITIASIIVMAIKGIMITTINRIRGNIMVVTVTDIDSITQDVTGIITVENPEITVTVIISAISVAE